MSINEQLQLVFMIANVGVWSWLSGILLSNHVILTRLKKKPIFTKDGMYKFHYKIDEDRA